MDTNNTQGKCETLRFKKCFVTTCENTNVSTPEKEFIYVPKNELKRKAWFEAIGWNTKMKIQKTTLYCCEDHLNLEEDLENYMWYKTMGGNKILKENALPRFNLKKPVSIEENRNHSVSGVSSHSNRSSLSSNSIANETMMSDTCTNDSYYSADSSVVQLSEEKSVQVYPDTRSKSCHTSSSWFTKNKSTQVSVFQKSSEVQCNLLLPNSLKKLKISDEIQNCTISSISSSILDSSFSIEPSTDTTSSAEKVNGFIKQDVYECYTRRCIEDIPKHLLGIDEVNMYIIDLLEKESGVRRKNIYLVLKKIKTNLSFAILAYEFGISESQACKIFRNDVHIIANFMKQLIVWPDKTDILLNLPIPFRYRYKDVQSIIDCFEIEIEKPSHSTHQSLTYSEYKHCNTAKWLIAVTPDGLIIFISEGICGRCSDKVILEKCGFLDVLADNSSVLADRGFKQVDALLQKKNCKLLRPPTVIKDVKSSKEDVKLTKQIASLRIHVERVINRIRHFQLLDIHTRVDNKLLDCLDSCVYIAAGIVNLQSNIIQQI